MIDDFDDYEVSLTSSLVKKGKKIITVLVSDAGEGYACVEEWGV